jgi:hypothetical protein
MKENTPLKSREEFIILPPELDPAGMVKSITKIGQARHPDLNTEVDVLEFDEEEEEEEETPDPEAEEAEDLED